MSDTPVLELVDVTVAAGNKTICRDINLTINPGECHILLGPNGSGKSSLLGAVMGIKPFVITSGTVKVGGVDVTHASPEERARAGLGMAFQRPPAFPGVSVRRLAQAVGANAQLETAAADMQLAHLIDRDINVGFSGGELKRWEIMKLELQQPTMCLFDEPESGVDLEQVAVVGDAVNRLLAEGNEKPVNPGEPSKRGAIVITHTGFILDYVNAAEAHLMVGGRIIRSGDPKEMFAQIREHGYGEDSDLAEPGSPEPAASVASAAN